MLGRRAAATDAMAEAVRIDPSSQRALWRFAWFASLVGRGDEAFVAATRAIELNPLEEDAWFALGWSAWALKRWDVAEDALVEARRLAPSASHTHNNLGALYAKLGRFEDALVCFEHALELDARSIYAYGNTAYCLRALDRWEEARAFVERDGLRRLYEAEESLQRYESAELRTRRAQALYDLGRIDDSHDELERALSLSRSPDETMRPLRLFASAKVLRGADSEAFELAQRLVVEFGDDAFTLSVATWIGWLIANADLAQRAYETAAGNGLDPAAVASCAAEAALARGETQEAKAHLIRNIELSRSLTDCCTHAELALTYLVSGETRSAAEELREAERADPNCSTVIALRERGKLVLEWRDVLECSAGSSY
jgi:tetratricopeptide (TPR) repeat protein